MKLGKMLINNHTYCKMNRGCFTQYFGNGNSSLFRSLLKECVILFREYSVF